MLFHVLASMLSCNDVWTKQQASTLQIIDDCKKPPAALDT